MKLLNMTASQFEEFRKASVERYAEDLSAWAGLAHEQGAKRAQEQFQGMLPQGVETPDHFFKVLTNEAGEEVGHLWYWFRGELGKKTAFICDIYFHPQFRGQGYGTKAIQWLEATTREAGLSSMSLHVFGHNERAAKLYETLGFRATSIQMKKEW